jgi:tRNA-dihydrouridine synthase C
LGLALKDFDERAKLSATSSSLTPLTWQEMIPHLTYFWELVQKRISHRHQCGRFKQWLNFLRKHFVEAEVAYLNVRTVNDPQLISAWLQSIKPQNQAHSLSVETDSKSEFTFQNELEPLVEI